MSSGSDVGWRVVDATFETSADTVAACPEPDGPELAIAGRSNVGKSSLLNALCARRGLARVSRTPGRTQLLNVFRVRAKGPAGAERTFRIVDLPGYGYTAGPKRVRDGFAPMIEGYLAKRPSLVGLVLLVDLRRGLGDLDFAMLEFASGRRTPSLLVATKCDKLGVAARGKARRAIADAVGVRSADVVLTSATAGIGIRDGGGLVDDLVDLVDAAATDDDPVAREPVVTPEGAA